jgi:hypothetical protein
MRRTHNDDGPTRRRDATTKTRVARTMYLDQELREIKIGNFFLL